MKHVQKIKVTGLRLKQFLFAPVFLHKSFLICLEAYPPACIVHPVSSMRSEACAFNRTYNYTTVLPQYLPLEAKKPVMRPNKQVRTRPGKDPERVKTRAKNKAAGAVAAASNSENNLTSPSKSEEDLLDLIAEIIVEAILKENE